MRVALFGNAPLVDELVAHGTLDIERTGEARYVLRVRGDDAIDIAMWTTRRGRIVAQPSPDPPSWLTLAVGPHDELESLRAAECLVHLEHMRRGLYFLGLSRTGDEHGA